VGRRGRQKWRFLSQYGEGMDRRIEYDDDDEGVEKKSGMKCDLVRRWGGLYDVQLPSATPLKGFVGLKGRRVESRGRFERGGSRMERGREGKEEAKRGGE
jgi:hypothetical protein